MSIRNVIFASASILAAAGAPAFAQDNTSRCEETSFRVYFAQGATSVDATTQEILDAAARNVVGCDYSEIRIALDASSPLAAQRGRAIAAAMDEGAFDATHIVARTGTQRIAFRPDYAEVTLSPTPTQPEHLDENGEVGV